MHIVLADRWRNVRTVPTKTPSRDFFGVLRGLLVGHERQQAEGQLEFECDQEFMDALVQQARADAREGVDENVVGAMVDHLARPSFDGVPIVLLEPDAA